MQTFRDFMETALYDPAGGFYPRRTPSEDFYTAPELHPAFGGVLAADVARRLDALRARGVPGPYSVVEMGSGTGRLARQVLGELRRRRPDWASAVRYVLVERCREALLESVEALASEEARVLGCTALSELSPCSGVFLSNELVDAFPVHLLEKRDGEVREVFVDEAGGTVLGPLSRRDLKGPADAVAAHLAEGERHAVNLEALSWLREVSERLKAGWLLTIDYGSRYHGQANPPRAFKRHRQPADLTADKGGQDLTASVDFEALIVEGRRLGLALEAFVPLGRFLLEGGIMDWLEEGGKGSAARDFSSRAQVKTLIHPEGMGEVFKVLVQRREGSPELGAMRPLPWSRQ